MTEHDYKSLVKQIGKEKSFEELSIIQNEHSEVKHINFENIKKPQDYPTSKVITNETSMLLFNMHCECVRGITNSLHKLHNGNTFCPFQCQNEHDTQPHILRCQKLIKHLGIYHKNDLRTVEYNYLFGTTVEQIKIVKLFQLLMTIQERLLEENQEPACHGNNSGP